MVACTFVSVFVLMVCLRGLFILACVFRCVVVSVVGCLRRCLFVCVVVFVHTCVSGCLVVRVCLHG